MNFFKWLFSLTKGACAEFRKVCEENEAINIGKSNMAYLRLDMPQYAIFSELMLDISHWEVSLDVFVRSRCQELGFSGDILACAVAEWVRLNDSILD